MKKYLRCVNEVYPMGSINLGGRYEVVRETETFYYTKSHGNFTKEPDSDGLSYRTWFVLETEGDESVENITEIDGVKYREVKRKAAVGEKVKVINASEALGFSEGDVFIVEDVEWRFPAAGLSDGANVLDDAYVVLEPVVDIAADDVDLIILQRELNGLKRKQAELTKQVDGLADAFAKLVTKQQAAKIVVSPQARRKTEQERRDEIVAEAKLDVAGLERTSRVLSVPTLRGGKMSFYPHGNSNGNSACDGVKYVVNRNKRTVVVLIHWLDREETVWARGIAKAAPGDCFNVHIGKAIALRRALGLEVPTEYVNAPQPTEPRVGDVVIGKDDAFIPGLIGTVSRLEGDVYGGLRYSNRDIYDYPRCLRIIDDSREVSE